MIKFALIENLSPASKKDCYAQTGLNKGLVMIKAEGNPPVFTYRKVTSFRDAVLGKNRRHEETGGKKMKFKFEIQGAVINDEAEAKNADEARMIILDRLIDGEYDKLFQDDALISDGKQVERK